MVLNFLCRFKVYNISFSFCGSNIFDSHVSIIAKIRKKLIKGFKKTICCNYAVADSKNLDNLINVIFLIVSLGDGFFRPT